MNSPPARRPTSCQTLPFFEILNTQGRSPKVGKGSRTSKTATENIQFPFHRPKLRSEGVKFRGAPIRYLCSLLLICCGTAGILFSPSVGLFGGTQLRSFTMNDQHEYSWGVAVSVSEIELPFVQNHRGLFFMNLFLAGSLGAFFGGVHWFAALRRKQLVPAS